MNQKFKIKKPEADTNILYYDAIAADYDRILNDDEKNVHIRDEVARKFATTVHGGNVLDFGGGTGRDLEWLLSHHYHVLFCEPSGAMRQIAIERRKTEFPGSEVFFFEDEQADYRKWNDSFPFEDGVDAVLANFAVFNCIQDIDELFDKLALVLKKGGQVIALMLDNHLMKRLRTNTRGTIQSLFSGKPVNLFVDYKNRQQEVYIHSNRAIRNASKSKFELKDDHRLNGYGFRLIHLVRK